ncbi:MAG: hypothetical protein J6S58_00955, partial [Lentisphaeria bacterium]|nr:hypothetical protein [Lentisphaeria bacterium]
IKDKDYRICPENCRLELITPRPNAIYECRIDTPIKARQNQELNLSQLPERSPHAGGLLLFPRKLQKITFVKYLDEESEGAEENPALLNVPEQETPEQETPADVSVQEEKPLRKKAAGKRKNDTPTEESSEEKAVSPSAEGSPEEDWGISQPELGF